MNYEPWTARNCMKLPHSWYLCNTGMPISSNHQSEVTWLGFEFLMLDLNDKSSMWISHTPRISDAIWGTPNPVESSKVWNLSRLLFICHPGPFMANLAFAHGLITEVNATDALHCQQICVVLLDSLVVFKCFLLLFESIFFDFFVSLSVSLGSWISFLPQPVDTSDYFVGIVGGLCQNTPHCETFGFQPTWKARWRALKRFVLSMFFLRNRVRLVWHSVTIEPPMILACVQQCKTNFQSCFKFGRRSKVHVIPLCRVPWHQDCWLGSKMQVPARSSGVRRCNRFVSACENTWKHIFFASTNGTWPVLWRALQSAKTGPQKC